MSGKRKLGPYDLRDRVGQGGMGEVWRATWVGIDGIEKAVAVKLIVEHLAGDPEFRGMFVHEARMSMMLNHSNIVHVFDAGLIENELYMAMEWIEGRDLHALRRELWAKGLRMPVPVAAYILGQLLRALAYAHELPREGSRVSVIHRDISPHNVLVSVFGEVKLTDFGVARLASEQTAGKFVKGKLRYMCREQLEGHSNAATVDLYAIGAVFHELLEGSQFRSQARDEPQLVGLIASGRVPDLSPSVAAQLDPILEQLRVGLLQPDPSKRISSASAALDQLRSWPHYRDASAELERIVRHGAAGLRAEDCSRPTERLDLNFEGQFTRPLARSMRLAPRGAIEGSLDPKALLRVALMLVMSGMTSVLVTRLVRDSDGPPPASVQEHTPEPQVPHDPKPLTEPPPPLTEPPPPLTEPPSPEPEPDPHRIPKSTVPVPPAEPPPPAPIDPPPPRPKQPINQEPVGEAEVEFGLSGQLFYAWIKVAGKKLPLEPAAELTLPSGSHRVYMRIANDEDWQLAGTIVLEAEGHYEIRMRDDYKLDLRAR